MRRGVAQFDVYRFAGGYAVDCQHDLHSGLDTRFVVPLAAARAIAIVKQRLNPVFDVDGQSLSMMTEFALTVDQRDLGKPIASLANRRYEVLGAIDVLVTGV